METLPRIDFTDFRFGDLAERRAVARRIADACAHYGFFYLTGHGVPEEAIAHTFEVGERFFALPLEQRMACRAKARNQNRGYQPMFDTKHGDRPDGKESFDMGFPLPPDDPDVLAGLPFHAVNTWPDDPELRHAMEALYFSMLECGRNVLRAMAMALDADENFFVSRCRKPITNMRILHYPPQELIKDRTDIGAGEHTDKGLITLLLNDRRGGLEVKTPAGDWIEAPPMDGAIIINVGRLLTRWTNGRFVSTVHRVYNRTGLRRYSIPQFHHADYRAVIDPRDLPGVTDPKFEPVVAGDFVAESFRGDRASWREAAA